MGEFKPLKIYSDNTFLFQIISNLDIICDQIVIVTGFNSEKLQSEIVRCIINKGKEKQIDKIKFVENIAYEKGMFTSMQKGLSKVKTNWVIYHFVDQPGLPQKFYSDFSEQIDESYNWIQPSYKKRGGHPILFKNELFNYFIEADEDSNLRELSKYPIVKKRYWECDYKNILQDIDTQEDYLSSINPQS